MSLKLFRTTGYSSLLMPGETRQAMHPAWVIVVTSVWAGFVCNVLLWRGFWTSAGDSAGLGHALASGLFVAAASAVVLSVLGWRKTLKPAATLILFAGALIAYAGWVNRSAAGSWLRDSHVLGEALPSFASLLQWQAGVMLAGLGLVPAVWIWQARLRRLPGPKQFNSNVIGILAGGALLAASGVLLFGGP
jgi:glucan phosphoethanolaminetransferase (alkaline phosphatase superfamily)